ncbi:acyltransferase [Myroides odoratimimus]|uniref:acyltransferase n=1 Tax=Myroides odoratimimus TaxID=76832 RepID=UPI002577E334|nr:acyltransferase [Myroides odoratimimus]MDM1517654.1 acyltransferase [Myroides odoratimimus]
MRIIKVFKNNQSKFSFKKLFFLFLYKYMFKHFPKSTNLLFGSISKRLRYYCCKNIFKYCGKNVNIEKGANFGSGFELIINDNSGIGLQCRVPSNIIIGRDVMMGPNCYILDANHSFDRIDIPMINQGHVEKKQTIIEDDVWIGRDVVMTPGRIVKKGTILGVRCLLTKDFPEYAIIGGNPGRLLKLRNER